MIDNSVLWNVFKVEGGGVDGQVQGQRVGVVESKGGGRGLGGVLWRWGRRVAELVIKTPPSDTPPAPLLLPLPRQGMTREEQYWHKKNFCKKHFPI